MANEVFKVLGPNDIKDRLGVPRSWMYILRPQPINGEIQAIRALWHGYFWEFFCEIRAGGHGARLKLEEWNKFVTYAGIQERDRLILQAEENLKRGTNYKIRVQRKELMIVGKTCRYLHVMNLFSISSKSKMVEWDEMKLSVRHLFLF